jgi:glycosyltransferase involved in cell wall biosynthesis
MAVTAGHSPQAHAGRDTDSISVTAIVPCFNEEEGVEQAYVEIREQLDRYAEAELLFIDDGSTDRTLEEIKRLAAADPTVKYLSFARNYGLEAAFSAGFKYARNEWTVQLDADLQSPPEEMHKLLARAVEGYDVVFGVRENRQDPWLRRVGSSAQHWFARRFLGIELLPGASVWRVVRTSVAKKIVALRLGTPYFIATVPLVGARYTGVTTSHNPRRGGTPKWTFRRLFAHSLDLFFGFSYRLAGLAFAFLGLSACLGLATFALALAGVLGAAGVAVAVYVNVTIGIAASGLVLGYAVRAARSQPRPAQFYIREANIPLDPDDDLYEYEYDVPRSARRGRRAA